MSPVTAAGLGCRFATAYRAVTVHGRVRAGDWVAVHGCGGVGLSAVMVAVAAGAQVVAIDVSPVARDAALAMGAAVVLDGAGDVAEQVHRVTGGGAAVSLDALGSRDDGDRARSCRCAAAAGTSRSASCSAPTPRRRCRWVA